MELKIYAVMPRIGHTVPWELLSFSSFHIRLVNAYNILIWNPEEKRPFGRSRRWWEDNIRIYRSKIMWGYVDWIHLVQDRDQGRNVLKVKLSLCFFNWASRHEGVLGNGSIAPRIPDVATRRNWVVIFTPRPLYLQGKSPWYPLDRSLSGPQNRSGHVGEEKNSQPLLGLQPTIIQPVTQRYTTELSQLNEASGFIKGRKFLAE
jgi:hypothetical protein